MPPEFVQVGLVVAQGALLAFYWWHCAKPALELAGARRRTLFVVPAIGAISWLSMVASTALDLAGEPAPSVLTAVGIASGVWYLAGWPLPDLVARFSGGRDPLKALRFVVWGLGASADRVRRNDGDSADNAEAAYYRDRLERFSGTSDTERFIDLWLREAEATLDGHALAESADRRHEAIREEAHRLWPEGDDWQMAALV
jgi:hypothetical protein